MGIDILPLHNQNESSPTVDTADLGRLSFHEYTVPLPEMRIWLMVAQKKRALFPWWDYDSSIDREIQMLNSEWAIASPQSFFDCLFLSTLKGLVGSQLYVIFPGVVRNEGWSKLREIDKVTFQRGQGCVYHLQGGFSNKLSVNWVPFWQRQSLVKDPSFSSMWRMFLAGQSDDVTNCISFFSLKDQRLLPKVINLLIEPDDKRSEKISEFVDWFGLYSSPLSEEYLPTSVVYTKNGSELARLALLRDRFAMVFESAKAELMKNPHPSTALKLLTRQAVV